MTEAMPNKSKSSRPSPVLCCHLVLDVTGKLSPQLRTSLRPISTGRLTQRRVLEVWLHRDMMSFP